MSLLIHLSNLRGWTPAAFWEDLKFDAKHYADVSRIVLVTEESPKQWLATLTKPFTEAEVRSFDEAEIASARSWVTASRERH